MTVSFANISLGFTTYLLEAYIESDYASGDDVIFAYAVHNSIQENPSARVLKDSVRALRMVGLVPHSALGVQLMVLFPRHYL